MTARLPSVLLPLLVLLPILALLSAAPARADVEEALAEEPAEDNQSEAAEAWRLLQEYQGEGGAPGSW